MQRKGLADWTRSIEHMRTAVDVLYAAVVKAYNGSMAILMDKSVAAGENVVFSKSLDDVMQERGWKPNTREKYFSTIKKVLGETPAAVSFVTTLVLPREKVLYNRSIGQKYGSENTPFPNIKERLEGWIQILKAESGAQSHLSIRLRMSFFMAQCLPRLGLDLEDWPSDPGSVALERLQADAALLKIICGAPGTRLSKRKASWFRVFLVDILKVEFHIPAAYFQNAAEDEGKTDEHMATDVHRIKSSDLDAIYEQCKGSARGELWYLLFITTGLRIGGVAQIRIDGVADLVDGQYVVRTQLRTKEKGRKWISAPMTQRVQFLVGDWLQNHRPAMSSPFLFPGNYDGHVATNTIRTYFRGACAQAGLSGPEYHPHAFRHTYAHLLLETGNSVDVIAKCLNHSSSSTTEKFYLKENIEEVLERATIPWLVNSEKKRPVALPRFLDNVERPDAKEQQVAKKARLDDTLSRLDIL